MVVHDGAEGDGTRLTESWEFRPAGRDYFRAKYGDDAQAQIDNRVRAAHAGIPATLAAIKAVLRRADGRVTPAVRIVALQRVA